MVHDDTKSEKEIRRVEFKEFFSMMKNRISDGADILYFFKDMIAMITEVLEEEWDTNDHLFSTPRKPPHIQFRRHDSYKFETPDDTGTGSNFKGMIVYDLAILQSTALPALAHDSLLFKHLEKDVEDGIIRIYDSCKNKQIFIAYDKQDYCRPATKKILEENAVICLSNDGNELYGRSWNKEVNENEDEL